MIRLILLILFFLLSLLAVFKAPAFHLWLAAIFVSEFPLILTFVTIVLLATGFWVTKYQLAGTVIGILALVLFLSPVSRAILIARDLRSELDVNFPEQDQRATTPFSFAKLFKGPGDENIQYKTLSYVSYTDSSLTLDFYPAQLPGNRPCVAIVHGGSWSGGDSQQLPELNSYLARAGYNVASVNYRLSPKYKNPLPAQDVQAAISYLKSNSEELNIDTTNFVLLGRSAGAQVALLTAYTINIPGLKGVIDFYGPADMVWGYSIPSNPLIMDSRKVMENYLGGSYAKVPQNYVASSPLEFVNKSSVPTLIIHGENDVLVAYEHSRRLTLKLTQNGVKHFLLTLPWATHGFDYNIKGPGGQLSTYAVERFLNHITR